MMASVLPLSIKDNLKLVKLDVLNGLFFNTKMYLKVIK